MADNENVAVTDEELELERQRELEEEEKNSDVDTSIPTGEEPEEETEPDEVEETKPSDEADTQEQAPDGADEDAEPRQTRKERRAERARKFAELRKDYRQRDEQRRQVMDKPQEWKPLDYNNLSEDATVDQLEADRTAAINNSMQRGAQVERFYAEQERFNEKVEDDYDYITSRPEFSFMNPDSDNFDADLTSDMEELYLGRTGYDDSKKIYNNPTVRFKQFAPTLKGMMDKYAATQNTSPKPRTQSGVKPGGAARQSYRTFTPEQIARMSPAQYTRYEKDLDRQINERLAKGI